MTITIKAKTVDGNVEVASPGVGQWCGGPAVGAVVTEGMSLGVLRVLGVDKRIVAGKGVSGRVTARFGAPQREPEVQFGDTLLTLDSALAFGESAEEAGAATEAGGLAFVAPMSGRFYARPAPDKPVFVSVGDEIKTGATVALLEVMKTFNRMQYGGDGMPARAKVIAVEPDDGDDLNRGDVILRLEALD